MAPIAIYDRVLASGRALRPRASHANKRIGGARGRPAGACRRAADGVQLPQGHGPGPRWDQARDRHPHAGRCNGSTADSATPHAVRRAGERRAVRRRFARRARARRLHLRGSESPRPLRIGRHVRALVAGRSRGPEGDERNDRRVRHDRMARQERAEQQRKSRHLRRVV